MKKDSKEKCHSIYWNLIELIEKFEAIEPFSYIRELMQTERCDNFNDLTQIRQDVEAKLGKDAFERITGKSNYSKDDISKYQIEKLEDEEKARDTLMHYHYWHRKILSHCLPWDDRIYYETIYQTHRIAAVFGIIGGSYGAYKWVKKQPKFIDLLRIKKQEIK